jgi:hypothetical protein
LGNNTSLLTPEIKISSLNCFESSFFALKMLSYKEVKTTFNNLDSFLIYHSYTHFVNKVDNFGYEDITSIDAIGGPHLSELRSQQPECPLRCQKAQNNLKIIICALS